MSKEKNNKKVLNRIASHLNLSKYAQAANLLIKLYNTNYKQNIFGFLAQNVKIHQLATFIKDIDDYIGHTSDKLKEDIKKGLEPQLSIEGALPLLVACVEELKSLDNKTKTDSINTNLSKEGKYENPLQVTQSLDSSSKGLKITLNFSVSNGINGNEILFPYILQIAPKLPPKFFLIDLSGTQEGKNFIHYLMLSSVHHFKQFIECLNPDSLKIVFTENALITKSLAICLGENGIKMFEELVHFLKKYVPPSYFFMAKPRTCSILLDYLTTCEEAEEEEKNLKAYELLLKEFPSIVKIETLGSSLLCILSQYHAVIEKQLGKEIGERKKGVFKRMLEITLKCCPQEIEALISYGGSGTGGSVFFALDDLINQQWIFQPLFNFLKSRYCTPPMTQLAFSKFISFFISSPYCFTPLHYAVLSKNLKLIKQWIDVCPDLLFLGTRLVPAVTLTPLGSVLSTLMLTSDRNAFYEIYQYIRQRYPQLKLANLLINNNDLSPFHLALNGINIKSALEGAFYRSRSQSKFLSKKDKTKNLVHTSNNLISETEKSENKVGICLHSMDHLVQFYPEWINYIEANTYPIIFYLISDFPIGALQEWGPSLIGLGFNPFSEQRHPDVNQQNHPQIINALTLAKKKDPALALFVLTAVLPFNNDCLALIKSDSINQFGFNFPIQEKKTENFLTLFESSCSEVSNENMKKTETLLSKLVKLTSYSTPERILFYRELLEISKFKDLLSFLEELEKNFELLKELTQTNVIQPLQLFLEDETISLFTILAFVSFMKQSNPQQMESWGEEIRFALFKALKDREKIKLRFKVSEVDNQHAFTVNYLAEVNLLFYLKSREEFWLGLSISLFTIKIEIPSHIEKNEYIQTYEENLIASHEEESLFPYSQIKTKTDDIFYNKANKLSRETQPKESAENKKYPTFFSDPSPKPLVCKTKPYAYESLYMIVEFKAANGKPIFSKIKLSDCAGNDFMKSGINYYVWIDEKALQIHYPSNYKELTESISNTKINPKHLHHISIQPICHLENGEEIKGEVLPVKWETKLNCGKESTSKKARIGVLYKKADLCSPGGEVMKRVMAVLLTEFREQGFGDHQKIENERENAKPSRWHFFLPQATTKKEELLIDSSSSNMQCQN